MERNVSSAFSFAPYLQGSDPQGSNKSMQKQMAKNRAEIKMTTDIYRQGNK